VADECNMGMEHGWNFYDGGKPTYSEENLLQYRFVHQKSNTEWPVIEPQSPRKGGKD